MILQDEPRVRVNLGCGNDVRPGYVNVDFRQTTPEVLVCDLSKRPWPFVDSSVHEVLMLDFLEHFPWAETGAILDEVWRILRPEGYVDVQVPDFAHVGRAAMMLPPFMCNSCGFDIVEQLTNCPRCVCPITRIQDEAVRRLYGGQNYEGNFHMTAFDSERLCRVLASHGFKDFLELEHDHQRQNWNTKWRAFKGDLW